MTGAIDQSSTGPLIRETYEEYDVGESRVGVISDPENEYAWIWSDGVRPLTP